ncbi:queuosine precursor transporter [Spartinivicinus poritis]|uniref:Probable queuosine precursor transporter n=1 Tax=Spartinivicinus poritis TaxID=2994640 RepID=A0ABT5U9S0_9GAMM|nr:queuosine precursor transporter [Spartinivicinus sp. A2-2]MDE1462208.1 queuosine precursor transporter [Spartinivicinus sp. A2-2]
MKKGIRDEDKTTHKYALHGFDSIEGKVILTVTGIGKRLAIPIELFFTDEMMDSVSERDFKLICMHYYKKTNTSILFDKKERSERSWTAYAIMISILSAILISSNFSGLKPINLLGTELVIPIALLFYPITYIINDVINEFYGLRMARKGIQIAFLSNIFFCAVIFAALQISPINHWPLDDSFNLIGTELLSVFFASMIAYLVSENLNAVILSKIRSLTNSRWLYLRVLGSTLPSTIIDSLLFCTIAFWHTLGPEIVLVMITSQIIVKSIYALISVPMTYAAHALMRQFIVTEDSKQKDQNEYTTRQHTLREVS